MKLMISVEVEFLHFFTIFSYSITFTYRLPTHCIWCGQPAPSFHGRWPFSACTLHVIRVLTGSVCGHSGRDDFTTQARLIYVGKAPKSTHRECGED